MNQIADRHLFRVAAGVGLYAPKRCGRCGKTKAATEFGRNPNTPSGLKCYCKACSTAVTKSYVVNNREAVAQSTSAYRKSNAHRISSRGRSYRSRPEVRAKRRKQHEQWREQNPHRVQAYRTARRQERRKPAWVFWPEVEAFHRLAREMTESTGVPHEVDHRYPLKSEKVCGLNTPKNLAVVPRALNRAKGNKLPGDLSHELWDAGAEDVFYV